MQALEAFRDFQSRSNLDAVRRHTQAILEDQGDNDFKWNDTIFLKTIKSIAENGDIDLCANIQVELSPTYKRTRADSLSQRMAVAIEASAPPFPVPQQQAHSPDLPHPHAVSPFLPSKEPPIRPREHEKWKIIPKKVYDKTM